MCIEPLIHISNIFLNTPVVSKIKGKNKPLNWQSHFRKKKKSETFLLDIIIKFALEGWLQGITKVAPFWYRFSILKLSGVCILGTLYRSDTTKEVHAHGCPLLPSCRYFIFNAKKSKKVDDIIKINTTPGLKQSRITDAHICIRIVVKDTVTCWHLSWIPNTKLLVIMPFFRKAQAKILL